MRAALAEQEPLSTEQIKQRIEELGDWFHNMEIAGVQTAPNHFLGDYPRVKWRQFRHAIPADLRGKTVLDIGCNGGFYSIEMKRRGAERVDSLFTIFTNSANVLISFCFSAFSITCDTHC
jgi:tRNA (mo5U34)-methyltransferase